MRHATGALLAALSLGIAAAQAASQSGLGCLPAQSGWGTPEQGLAAEAHGLINAERARAGLAPLAFDIDLARAALWKAGHMVVADYFDHFDPPQGRSPGQRARDCGFVGMRTAENIAHGYPIAAEVVAGWMASDGHRANILQPDLTRAGIAASRGANGHMRWVQQFGDGTARPMVPPAPVADVVRMAEDAPARTLSPLANDRAMAGDVLRVVAVEGARRGVAAVAEEGRGIRYRPRRDRNGTDTLTYTVRSLSGATARQTLRVVIAPRNDRPVARPDRIRLRPHVRRVRINVLANDRDVDGDRLRVVILKRPRGGVVRVERGRIVFTARRARGRLAAVVRYAAVDPAGARAVSTVTIMRPASRRR